ncbi:MAG: hypothetical protein JWR32_5982 [Mycobacterium sp.]|jgi:hypothetical protein|nr:hypothetical protein [Mycobacterium sp.]
MRIKLSYIIPVLTASAAAAAIAAAPTALATSTAAANSPQGRQTRIDLGPTGSQCKLPGNVQPDNSPPYPYYPCYPSYHSYGGYHSGGGDR